MCSLLVTGRYRVSSDSLRSRTETGLHVPRLSHRFTDSRIGPVEPHSQQCVTEVLEPLVVDEVLRVAELRPGYVLEVLGAVDEGSLPYLGRQAG